MVVVGTCPDFGVITAIPQPLRTVARTLGLRLARAQAAAVRAAGGVPVPFADLMAPEFLQAPERDVLRGQFHPSAAGYALAAKQLLPALCKALGEWTSGRDTARAGVAVRRDAHVGRACRRRHAAVAAPTTGVPAPIVGPRRARFV